MENHPVRVAIVGTAGRGEAASRLSYVVYASMLQDARQRVAAIEPDPQHLELVSGGAAWADHMAVLLFLQGAAARLTLFLPAPLTGTGFYKENAGDWRSNPGGTSNHYHRQFTAKLQAGGVKGASHLDLLALKSLPGAQLKVGHGFHQRNIVLAQYLGTGHLLAYTFGVGGGPADGGTLHTWNCATKAHKQHIPIHTLRST